MARKNVRTPRLTRRDKARQERIAEISPVDKTVEQRSPSQMPRLVPANNNQRSALAHLESGKPVVFLAGSAGVGKSLLAAYRAAVLLKTKQVEKVYLIRPAVGVGKSIGLLPGTAEEKLAPYFAQTITHIEKFLGKGFTNYCLEKKIIEMQPAEYIRGRSFEDCFVICEESQGFTHSEFEMMLTRMGSNASVCFTGDEKQSDLKVETGLRSTIRMIERTLQTHPGFMTVEDMDALDDQIGIVKFTPEDVVRSGLTRAFVKLYFNT